MNRIIIICTFLIFCNSIVFSQGTFQINSNVEMVMSGNVHLVTTEMDLTNDGIINGGTQSEVAIISAATPSTISIDGTGTTEFNKLEINTADLVMLNQNILVNDTLNFTSGELDVNGNILNFGLNGIVNNETNGESIIGQTGGTVNSSATINAPNQVNPGNLGMSISSSANLGSTTISRGHVPFSTTGGGLGIERYYDISAANNSGLNATLRFHYLDGELNGLNESDLELFRSTDGGITWTLEGFDARNTTENWVEKSGIDGFSVWTLSTKNASLPVELVNFSAVCNQTQVELNWVTASEINNKLFEIQTSRNGTDWTKIGTVEGGGNSAQMNFFRFVDEGNVSNNYYRLKQIDFDGTATFSEIVAVDCFENDKLTIQLFPNPTTDKVSVVLAESTDEIFELKLVNSLGQVIEEKTINTQIGNNQTTFSLAKFPDGFYELMVAGKSGTRSFRVIKTQH